MAWVETDKKAITVLAGFPDFRILELLLPDIFAAGETYPGTITAINNGYKGKVRLGTVERTLTTNEKATFDIAQFMPYDDISRLFTAEVLGRGKVWTKTDSKTALIKAGFPLPVFTKISYEEIAKPGTPINIIATVINNGYTGNIGIRAFNEFTGNTTNSEMPRKSKDESAEFKYSCEMPGIESLTINLTPMSLGRNHEIITESPTVVTLATMDSIFVKLGEYVKFYGGKEEPLDITGFIAGENLEFAPGIGDVTLPAEIRLPVGAYPFRMTLAPGATKAINCSSIKYFYARTSRGIALIEGTRIAFPDLTSYEFSPIGISLRALFDFLPALPFEFGFPTPPLPKATMRKAPWRETIAVV